MILQTKFLIFSKNLVNIIKYNKILLTILIILFSSAFFGCISRSNSSVSYAIFLTPSKGAETTFIIPLVVDNKSGEIDQVMREVPISTTGNPIFEIIKTDHGHALKIITRETTEIWFSKDYRESGAEIRANKTLSMTNLTYDGEGKPTMKSLVFVNSTANQTQRFIISLHAGDSDRARILRLSGVNVTNGWHQFTVEEGYGIS